MNRRQFLSYIGRGAINSAIMYTVMGASALIKSPKQNKPTKQQIKVEDFNWAMVDAVTAKYHNLDDKAVYFFPLIAAYSMTFLLDKFLEGKLRDRISRITATTVAVGGQAIDLFSTDYATQLAQDHRFRRYGFDKIFFEYSLLHETLPTRKSLIRRGIFVSLGYGALSYFFPPAAGLYFPAGFLIYRSNALTHEVIKRSMDLGDRVNELVNKGRDRKEIKKYLDYYIRS